MPVDSLPRAFSHARGSQVYTSRLVAKHRGLQCARACALRRHVRGQLLSATRVLNACAQRVSGQRLTHPLISDVSACASLCAAVFLHAQRSGARRPAQGWPRRCPCSSLFRVSGLGFRVQGEGPHAMHHSTLDVHEKRGREGTTEGRRRSKGEDGRAEERGTKEAREGRRGRGGVGDKGEETADTIYQNPPRIRLTHTHTCTHAHTGGL
jgi:hypothetical protein